MLIDRCISNERSYTRTEMFDKQPSELVVVASWVTRSSPDRAVQVRALAREIALCDSHSAFLYSSV